MLYYLSLGGNMGDTQGIFHAALADVESEVGHVERRSSVIRTAPWGFSAENDFLNMSVTVRSDMTAQDVLTRIWDIEKRYGRKRDPHAVGYASRTLDIDIVFADDMVMDTPSLKIPHPLCHRRRFVLEPMCEIAPEYVHPVIGKSIKTLLAECEE